MGEVLEYRQMEKAVGIKKCSKDQQSKEENDNSKETSMATNEDDRTWFPQVLVETIKQPPKLRQRHEIELVLPWLRKKIPLFNDLNSECMYDIVFNCEYEKFDKDDVIIKQGERGYRFYLVLRGSVDIYIDPSLSGEDNANAARREETALSKKSLSKQDSGSDIRPSRSASSKKSHGDESEKKKTHKPFHVKRDREFYGKYLGKQYSGYGFGEIALISDDNRRNATIIADEETEVLIIHKTLYDRSLKQYQEQEYVDRREFVDNHMYFGKWTPKFRRLLEMSFKRVVYNYDQTIFRQGDAVNGLYFVRSGRVRVTMDPNKHSVQYAAMAPFPTQNDVFELESLRPPKKKESSASMYDQTAILRPKRRGESAEKHKQVTICCAGSGECFGDLELLSNMDTMMSTITAMERTEIYFLDMKNFDRLVAKKNPATFDIMRFNVVTKLRTRVNSQQGKQIPIFNHLLFTMTEKAEAQNKKLPDLLTNKDVPTGSLLDSYQVQAFLNNKAELLKPSVPGAFYYKILMEERAKERLRMRKVAKFGLRHKKALFAMRSARSLTNLKDPVSEPKVDEPQEQKPATPNNNVTSVFEKTEVPEALDEVDAVKRENTEISEPELMKRVSFDLNEKTKPKPKEKKKKKSKKKSRENLQTEFEEPPPPRKKFSDWETGEKNLGDLETKVKNFAKEAGMTAYGYRIKTPCLPKLRRFNAQPMDDMPRPGGKVTIKTKACQFRNSQFLVKNHSHVRYHMLQKERFYSADLSLSDVAGPASVTQSV